VIQTHRNRKRAAVVDTVVRQHAELATSCVGAGLWLWETERNIVWMNPYCWHLIGASTDKVELDCFVECVAGAKSALLRKRMLDAVRATGTFCREFELARAAGEPFWIRAEGHSVSSENGPGLAGTLLDITPYKLVQQEAEVLRRQVIHLTRVSTMGELSGAVTHELNQPLTAILINAQAGQRLLSRGAASTDEIKAIFEDIIDDGRRADAVLTRLRNLIRNGQIDLSEIDVNEVVTEVNRLLNSELIERGLDVLIDCAPALPSVRADRIQLQQVLINLVRNACDAMAATSWTQRRLVVRTSHRGDGCIVVTVADNGVGLPESLRDNLFEPFVTTKQNGMGLGLTISRSIISAHRGEIWLEDNPGGGSIFGFSLPTLKRRAAWTNRTA
jgi:signal transduction histidine kinase